MQPILTKSFIRACAGGAYRRVIVGSHNRAAANDAYQRAFDRLFDMIGGPEGWFDLPEN